MRESASTSTVATGKARPIRWLRRVSTVVLLALALGVAVPTDVVAPASSEFPLSFVGTWLRTAKAFAMQTTGSLPEQKPGPSVNRGSYSDATDAKRGAGAKQRPVKGAIGADSDAAIGAGGKTGHQPGPFDRSKATRQAKDATAGSDVYKNPDGSYTRVSSTAPVNYKAKDGSWRPIDRSLVRGADGRLRQKANSTDIAVAGDSADAVLASVGIDASHSIAYGLLDAATVAPVIDGNAALYRGVWPGVDLKLEVTGEAVKESLILHSAAAGSTFDFPMRTEGLTLTVEKDGSIAARDADGKIRATIPAGFMVDSKIARHGDFTRSDEVRYELRDVDGAQVLRVHADAAWLNDPARVWPVTIDPTLTAVIGSAVDTYVQSDSTSNRGGENNFATGTWNGGGQMAKSLLYFLNVTAPYVGNTISKAQLRMFLTYSTSCSPFEFGVYAAASNWGVTSVQWPGPGTDRLLGKSAPAPGSACTNTGGNRNQGVWVDVELDRSVIQAWLADPTTYRGIVLEADMANSSSWKRFTSRDFSMSYNPELRLWYAPNEKPQVDMMYPPAGFDSPTLTPTLIAQGHDSDSTAAKFTYEFIVKEKTGEVANQIWTSGKIVESRTTIPPGILRWGNSYLWTVRVNDSLLDSSTVDYPISTPVPQPTITSALSQNGGKGFAANVGNYTSSATDAAVPTVGPPLIVQRSYNSLDSRPTLGFGQGWASLVDMKVTENLGSPISPPTVAVTYPGGNELAFGRNADNTFTPPAGRYATLLPVPEVGVSGYRLVDKDGTTYRFVKALGGTGGTDAVYGISSITDVHNRAQIFTYDAGNRITKIEAASKRALYLTWSVPSGSTFAHVNTVKTDQLTVGDDASRSVWTYAYTADRLTSVCAPASTGCTTYTYDAVGKSPYRATVMNLGPSGYWRPGASTAVANDEVSTGNTTMSSSVTSVTGPLAASGAKAAGFNGTNVMYLPPNLAADSPQRAISLWFQVPNGSTTAGVLAGQSVDDINTVANTSNGYTPTLYVDASGYLHGQFPTVPTVPSGSPSIALGSLISGSGRCMDVVGNVSTNGARVQLYDCLGTGNQQWTLMSDKTLRTTIGGVTKCLDAYFSGTTNGTELVIWDCHSGINQQWYLMGNGNIINANGGRCIDATYGGTANGTLLWLWDCHTPAPGHQTWTASSHTPMKANAQVNDGQWHHAVLSSGWSASSQALVQTLYLDGVAAPTNLIANPAAQQKIQLIGGGYLGASWPDNTTANLLTAAGPVKRFTGSIGEVAYFDHPLTQSGVTALQSARSATVNPLVQVNMPSGDIRAKVKYDLVSSLVTEVTDEYNGKWTIAPGTLEGSYQVHSSAVLAARPTDYWRMAESVGGLDAINEVAGGKATYNNVGLHVYGGPFDGPQRAETDPVHDNYAPTFSTAQASYVAMPPNNFSGAGGPNSLSMWFKIASGNTGVLYSWQDTQIGTVPTTYVPALYVGNDGKLHGKWCWCSGSAAPMVTDETVTDDKWHHVVLTTSTTKQSLYLDGNLSKTYTAAPVDGVGFGYVNVGAGYSNGSAWPGLPVAGSNHFTGRLGEVAFYRTELTAGQVASQFGTRDAARGPALARKYVVTDPGGGALTTETYAAVTGQRIAQTDGLGKQTQFGYDQKGFLLTTTDALGHVTTTYHDARGNTIQRITCQDQSADKCTSSFYEFFPDKTTQILQPLGTGKFDPRNDKLVKAWGPGTAPTDPAKQDPSTDNRFLTTYQYDATTGDETMVTDPLGRKASIAYTDGVVLGEGSALPAPAGLPRVVTTADGTSKSIFYFDNGDLAREVEPTGKTTTYVYDRLGRVKTQTTVTDTFPLGLSTTYDYDKASRVLWQQDPPVENRVTGSAATHTAKTTWTYNANGLRTQQLVDDISGGDADRTLSSEYTGVLQTASIDAKGKRTTYTYDGFGRVLTKTDPLGTIEKFTYDAVGQVLKSEILNYTGDPNSPQAAAPKTVETRAYDSAGRLTSVTRADNTATTYTYTDNGLPAKVTRVDAANRNPFVLEDNYYDPSGFLIKKITNNGATTRTFTVDFAGRQVSTTLDPTGLKRITTEVLNPDDQPVSTTTLDGLGNVVGYAESLYDSSGRQIAATTYLGDRATTPVGRWKLDEPSGATRIADSVGNSPGKVGTGVTFSSDHGGSAAFAATGENRIQTLAPVVDTMRSYTVSAWVKRDAASGNAVAVSQDGPVASTFQLAYGGTTLKWRMHVCPGSALPGCAAAESTANAALGTWTHLTGVYDAVAKTASLYVNGAFQSSVAMTNAGASSGPLAIGRGKWAGADADLLNGRVDDVQLYQNALTAGQISAIYAGTAPAADATVIRTSTTYDQAGYITSSTDSRGNTTDYVLDELGHQAITKTPEVLTEIGGGTPVLARNFSYVGYDTFGEVVETKDALGNRVVTEYDANGRVQKINLPSYTRPDTGAVLTPFTTKSYDDLGRMTSETNTLGLATTYVYDQFGRIVKSVAPAKSGGSAVTKVKYDLVGNTTQMTSPKGGITGATYDHLGRQVTTSQLVSQDAGATYTTTNVYGSAVAGDSAAGFDIGASLPGEGGWMLKSTSPGGVVTRSTYNAAGQLATATDGGGNVTSYQYAPAGYPSKTTAPDLTYQVFTHDRAGRLTATENFNPASPTPTVAVSKVSNVLDAAGNVVAVTDALQHTSTFTYDSTNLLTSQVEPVAAGNSITSTFGYDAAGRRTRFTDGLNHNFLTTYTTWGLPESTIEPATTAYPNLVDRTHTVAYNAAGKVAKSIAPGGVTITNTYDDGGNLTTQVGAGAEAATTTRSFGWDEAGRLETFTGAGAAINTVTYDDRNLPRSISGGGAGDTAYTYWPDGQVKARTDAAGQTDFTYDTAGRPRTVANTPAGIALTYDYNSLSAVSKITYGTNGNYRSFGYDLDHRLASDTLKTSAGTQIASIAYVLDANGNETSKTTTGVAGASSNTYSYDWANRLTSWQSTPAGGGTTTTTTYQYDKAGNRTYVNGRQFGYDEQNRLLHSTTSTYTYTPRGTMRTTYDGTNTLQSKADAFGQVKEQGYAGGTQTYTYDALGRAIKTGHLYTGVGNQLAADTSSTYVRGVGGEVLSAKSGAQPSAYAWTDLHTDVVAQFTATGAALTGSRTFEPLGKQTASAGTMVGSLGFQSEWTEATTGRVNMAARWYNTDTGQFDTRDTQSNDPSPASGDANRYSYGNGNPLVNTDPTGHMRMSEGGGAVAAAPAPSYPSERDVIFCETHPRVPRCKAVLEADGNRPPPPPPACREHCGKTFVSSAPNDLATIAAEIDKTKAALEEAYKAANKSFLDILLDVGVGFLLDMIGWTDIVDCFTKGDLWACGQMILGIIPWGKVFKMGKAILKAVDTAFSAYKAWRKMVKAAEEIISLGRRALEVLEKAQTAIDVTNTASTLVGGGPILPDLPTAGLPSPGKKGKGGKGGSGSSGGNGGGGKHGDGSSPSHDNRNQDAPTGRDSDGGSGGPAPDAAPSNNSRSSSSDGGNGGSCKIQTHSFDPATPVLMADGSVKPIGEVEVGEEVAATDPGTGETTARQVTALHRNVDLDLTDVTVGTVRADNTKPDKGGRDESAGTVRGPPPITLQTTDHHPFWDATDGRWVDAADLEVGHELTGPTGERLTVLAVRSFTGAKVMRDLTVDTIHTYYVLAGVIPVLVHNCDGEVYWVNESSSKSGAAAHYESGATGAGAVNPVTGVPQVPALDYVLHTGEVRSVRFDGFDQAKGELIDRKHGVHTGSKTQDAAMRQSLALEQNGYTGAWEVPNKKSVRQATRMMAKLNITNITVRLVPHVTPGVCTC
ncbi:RHS repeat-associated protein [Allocatelliglobosispora scoriae]|uniref:RHS repeat-associated protein n=1 Tax=Allocatelliglobosispora scoriae TaxID=643052 RepID=A0A841C0R5_9ACTN|nr:LamG-like jellyroll fold domain-containing protein [Allocatelliglobosispora scoriae]MBB5873446.1 RHS repeat-associated protein [Allocatelliglobosispora scoriae]